MMKIINLIMIENQYNKNINFFIYNEFSQNL